MNIVDEIGIQNWSGPFPDSARAMEALENGKVLVAPGLHFEVSKSERRFLSPSCLDANSKNVSYRPGVPDARALHGASSMGADRDDLVAMMRRYHEHAVGFMRALFPDYRLTPGFTSFRPAQVSGRATSWRKDDTRLHVDAFPSRPLGGLRILRLFSNVHPTAPRHWRIGEPFEAIAQKFLPRLSSPFPGSAWLLHLLRVTKTRRTDYDHMMLGIHDGMKSDRQYQAESPQMQLPLAPGATWACFTDSVSHAAMSGQFCFEQTFYLPVDSMQDAARSPLRVLERLAGRALV